MKVRGRFNDHFLLFSQRAIELLTPGCIEGGSYEIEKRIPVLEYGLEQIKNGWFFWLRFRVLVLGVVAHHLITVTHPYCFLAITMILSPQRIGKKIKPVIA